MEVIKVNFSLGNAKINQGEIFSEKSLYLIMSDTNQFIQIFNEFDEPIYYNKNNIAWICKQREE